MNHPTQLDGIKQFHEELCQRWVSKEAQIETMWRSFRPEKRLECLRASTSSASLLQHSEDTSLIVVCLIVPEWNVQDITRGDSDFLLNILRHRATASLTEQLRKGANGQPGGAAAHETL